MSAGPGERHPRRYRRRIVGLGAGLVIVVAVVGAVVSLGRVENDLEHRVADELAMSGVDDLDVEFSGQSGTVSCDSEIDDDQAEALGRAAASARDLTGVRILQVGVSCVPSVGESPTSESTASGSAATATPVTDEDVVGTIDATDALDATSPNATSDSSPRDTEPTLAELIIDDPQFSSLENALRTTGLLQELGGVDPLTVFAPSNIAFEALSPGVAGTLNGDVEVLSAVLEHHLTTDPAVDGGLVAGEIDMRDGTTVTVGDSPTGGEATWTVTSGDGTAQVTDPDLMASNGVLHVIDQILIPPGSDLGTDADAAVAVAEFVDGVFTLTGTVSDTAQRDALVAAAQSVLDPQNVVDEILADDTVAPRTDLVAALGDAISAMPVPLASGRAAMGDETITLTGAYTDVVASESLRNALADIEGVEIEAMPRPTAGPDDAELVDGEMAALVEEAPLRFDSGTIEVSPDSAAVLDRLAAAAKSYGGLLIEVRGYSDTGGDPARNELLSLGRAMAVADALAARGVPVDDLSTTGYGDADPVIVDGAEDPAASRRVEFSVELR